MVKLRVVLSIATSGLKDFFQSNTKNGLLFLFKDSNILKAKVVLPEPDIPVTQICLGKSCSLSLKGKRFFLA